ncbi:MAG: GNAT family N-acetyltransferase [Alphaproteobacteria bacterium]|nr:GNAT family N-acetyltransferase [Alphaproteobacteria bacterium]
MPRDILVRAARAGEADALSALCQRSKRHWGYDDDFMVRSAASLTVGQAAIGDGRVFVAAFTDQPDQRLGVAELAPLDDGVIDLDKLFVDPPAIGHGAGGLLFLRAALAARQRGARWLTILADPNAAAFYEKMGARFVRMAPSDAIPGRELPFYAFDLTAFASPGRAGDG